MFSKIQGLFDSLSKRTFNRGPAIFLAGVATLASVVAPAYAVDPRAPIYVGKTIQRDVHLWDFNGDALGRFDARFDAGDRIAIGDVNGDGGDEVVVANTTSHLVRVYDVAGILLRSFDAGYDVDDALAVGDVNGDGSAEILIAGDFSKDIDVFDMTGNLLDSFNSAFDLDDALLTGDLDGDGTDEIIVIGNFNGGVDIYEMDGDKIADFDSDYDPFDRAATGDMDGDGVDELLIANNGSNEVDVLSVDLNNESTSLLSSFVSTFDLADAFGAGDVDGDGFDEVVIIGDVQSILDVFDMNGNLEATFATNYKTTSGFAVGKNGYPDEDRDGLLDSWETVGIDVDADGMIDINLPAMGADPLHKDLFIELDWALALTQFGNDIRFSQMMVQQLKNAFALAPMDAGGVDNPDGTPGINLWIDTGNLFDPRASEGGAGINSCGDGIDNDVDGLTDGADPDCLAGDNFGGGNGFANAAGCLDGDFYDVKAANFANIRRLVFRYGILGDPIFSNACGGGRGEIGGNDFISFNTAFAMIGTVMHELGHNLELRHGGDNNDNCKPNYVSVMNYDHQFGIPQGIGTVRFDFSPPRFNELGDRGLPVLPTLEEDDLDENFILDPADTSNMFIYTDTFGDKNQTPLRSNPDYDSNPFSVDSGIQANIDDEGSTGTPAACANNSDNDTLTGHDDWSVIAINFRPFGDSLDSAINPSVEPEPTNAEMEDHWEELNTTDLEIGMVPLGPAVAGENLVYWLTVLNHGPNPAHETMATIIIPEGTTFVPQQSVCFESPIRTINCDLESVFAGEDRNFGVEVVIDSDLVHINGAPKFIVADSTVAHAFGPDPFEGNNSASAEITVIARADLEVRKLGVLNSPPAQMFVGDTFIVNLKAVTTNNGSSSPMDASLLTEAVAPAGATVAAPTSMTDDVLALKVDELRSTDVSFELGCTQAGKHTWTFKSTISPSRPGDFDLNPANDAQTTTVKIQCIYPVVLEL